MFAFKILNLRHCSEKLISILSFLSLGLLSLIFASKEYSPLPLPALPFNVSVFLFSANFALFGNTFIKFYKKREKESLSSLLFILSSFFISLVVPVFLLRYKFFFISFLISILSAYLLIILLKSHKDSFLSISFHLIVNIYFIYLSLSLFF